MPLGDILAIIPGAIIELPKAADEELDLLVNNKPIGSGTAVKVGENFGIRISYVGNVAERIAALGKAAGEQQARGTAPPGAEGEDLGAAAAQMMAGL